MDHWLKTTSHSNGIRTICNMENFVPIVVPSLSSSSSGSSSTSKTLSRQENHFSPSSSSSYSSPTESEFLFRERENGINSDTYPVQVSISVDEMSGPSNIDQANENPKPNEKEPKREQDDPLNSEIPE